MCDDCERLEREIDLLWGVVSMLARMSTLCTTNTQFVEDRGPGMTLLTGNPGERGDAWPPVPTNPQSSPSGSLQMEGREFRAILSRRMREWEKERTRPLRRRKRR